MHVSFRKINLLDIYWVSHLNWIQLKCIPVKYIAFGVLVCGHGFFFNGLHIYACCVHIISYYLVGENDWRNDVIG